MILRADIHITGEWEAATLTGTLDQQLRQTVLSMWIERLGLSFICMYQVILPFGVAFKLLFIRTYKDAHIVDFKKLQAKGRVLDDGDSIKVMIRSGEDNTFVNTIHGPGS